MVAARPLPFALRSDQFADAAQLVYALRTRDRADARLQLCDMARNMRRRDLHPCRGVLVEQPYPHETIEKVAIPALQIVPRNLRRMRSRPVAVHSGRGNERGGVRVSRTLFEAFAPPLAAG